MPRLPLEQRSSTEGLLALPIATALGTQPLGRFVRVEDATLPPSLFRKNLRPVIYVTGDVAGQIESPVYAIMAMNNRLDSLRVQGVPIKRYNAAQPDRLTDLGDARPKAATFHRFPRADDRLWLRVHCVLPKRSRFRYTYRQFGPPPL